jgi:predicted AlkP superfamily pyrophosphatase or phosphodiesterase
MEPALWQAYEPDVADGDKITVLERWFNGPARDRPRLAMVYLNGCDHDGHRFGPDSAEVTACIQRQDRHVARLIGLVEQSPPELPVALLVVSDHGMTATRGTLNPWKVLETAGIDANTQCAGPICNIYLSEEVHDQARRALQRALPSTKTYSAPSLPAELRYSANGRTGDIVLVADLGYRFDEAASEVFTTDLVSDSRGHHGHSPRDPDMGAILYAIGAGIRQGASLAVANSVDLVPTISHLLRIAPPAAAEGRVLHELLAPATMTDEPH